MAAKTTMNNSHKTKMAIDNPPKTIPPMDSPFDGPAVSGAARFFNFARLNTPVTTAAMPSTPPKRQIPQNGKNENRNPAPPLEMEMIARVFTGAAGLFGAGDVDKAILLEG
ncbi:MAG: hypothetical protein P8K79_03470 [Mariniblastus sp.]|nr:hypothetical protein [Mariniblastus sp.]